MKCLFFSVKCSPAELNDALCLKNAWQLADEWGRQKTGIPVKTELFNDGDALLDYCRSETPDIIPLDIVMPLLSGMDTAREIRKFNSGVKIIFLTSSPEFAVECLEAQNKKVVFTLSDESHKDGLDTISFYEKILTCEKGIFKCHRSYIVYMPAAHSEKNTLNASMAYPVSFTPAVSTAECMASWGSPMSTLDTDTCAVEMFPSVLPPGMSERFAYAWQGTPALSQMRFITAADTASVAYFWLP